MLVTRQSAATCAARNVFHVRDALSKLFMPAVTRFSFKGYATSAVQQEAVDQQAQTQASGQLRSDSIRYEYAHRDGKPLYRPRRTGTDSKSQNVSTKDVQRETNSVHPPKAEQEKAKTPKKHKKAHTTTPIQQPKLSVGREGQYVPQIVGTSKGHRNDFTWLNKVDKVVFQDMSPMTK